MPSRKEMEEAMRERQRAMDRLTPDQYKMLEQTWRQMSKQAARIGNSKARGND